MAKFLRDKAETAQRIAELQAQVEWARYELGAALHVANELGLTWTELGEHIGMTKAGASQMAKRQVQVRHLDDDEHERICRLIGAGDRVIRWQVREVVTKRPRRVVTLSTHLRRAVAERHARSRPGAQLWKVWPDGQESQHVIRPAGADDEPEAGAEPDTFDAF